MNAQLTEMKEAWLAIKHLRILSFPGKDSPKQALHILYIVKNSLW